MYTEKIQKLENEIIELKKYIKANKKEIKKREKILSIAVDEELELAEKIVREEMENAQSMDVKLDVDLNTGNSWYETK